MGLPYSENEQDEANQSSFIFPTGTQDCEQSKAVKKSSFATEFQASKSTNSCTADSGFKQQSNLPNAFKQNYYHNFGIFPTILGTDSTIPQKYKTPKTTYSPAGFTKGLGAVGFSPIDYTGDSTPAATPSAISDKISNKSALSALAESIINKKVN